MNLIRSFSILLLTFLVVGGFNLPLEAKERSKSKSYHKHYHRSKSHSTSFGLNLNIDPWPRETVVAQPIHVEQVTVYNPPLYPSAVYSYSSPAPYPASYVQQRVYYPNYCQQGFMVRHQAPVYMPPQYSYWNGRYY